MPDGSLAYKSPEKEEKPPRRPKITWEQAWAMIQDDLRYPMERGWPKGAKFTTVIKFMGRELEHFDPDDLGTPLGNEETRWVEETIQKKMAETHPQYVIKDWDETEETPDALSLYTTEEFADADHRELELVHAHNSVCEEIPIKEAVTLGDMLGKMVEMAESSNVQYFLRDEEAMWLMLIECIEMARAGKRSCVIKSVWKRLEEDEDDGLPLGCEEPEIPWGIVRALKEQGIDVVYQQDKHIEQDLPPKDPERWYAVCYWDGERPDPGTYRRCMYQIDTTIPIRALDKFKRDRILRMRKILRLRAERRKKAETSTTASEAQQ